MNTSNTAIRQLQPVPGVARYGLSDDPTIPPIAANRTFTQAVGAAEKHGKTVWYVDPAGGGWRVLRPAVVEPAPAAVVPVPASPVAVLPPRFVIWQAPGKVPVSTAGVPIDPQNPANWMTYDAALATGRPVGWVLNGDGYFFLDFDNCLDDECRPSPQAWAIIEPFQQIGAAIEISQSGRGVHIIGRYDPARFDPSLYRNKVDGWREFYTTGRFVAFGRVGWQGNPQVDCTAALLAPGVLDLRAPVEASAAGTCPVSDDAVLERVQRSQASASAAFGTSAPRDALWRADAAVLARFFPSESGAPFDHSAADAALCSHLAYLTHRDPAAMDRLFRRSGLMRPKWDRNDYRARTIKGAIGQTANVADWTPRASTASVPGAATHRAILTIADQIDHFAGCTYVRSLHQVLVPDGELVSPEQFRATFGGHEFLMDAHGKSTKSAFEAFTESRAHNFPWAKRTILRPELPFGEIIGSNNAVNAYLRPPIPTAGDVTPFLNHLAMLVLDEGDRRIILQWIAHVVQRPGVRTRWAPVLIGPPGIGKTFIFDCIKRAIGQRYCRVVRPKDLQADKNGWIHGALFATVEEVEMSKRRDMVEDLKPYITDEHITVRAMRTDNVTIENQLNWQLNSNHKGGVIKDAGDRRFAVFHTSETVPPDSYFAGLYDWAIRGGFEHVADWLGRQSLAGFPGRAPHTTSTASAIAASRGPIEQEIIDAIDAGEVGFRGGWVSSWAIRRMAEDARRPAPGPNAVAAAVEALGFVFDGRSSRYIVQEGGTKPRLYRLPHVPGGVDRYMAAQGYATTATLQLVVPQDLRT